MTEKQAEQIVKIAKRYECGNSSILITDKPIKSETISDDKNGSFSSMVKYDKIGDYKHIDVLQPGIYLCFLLDWSGCVEYYFKFKKAILKNPITKDCKFIEYSEDDCAEDGIIYFPFNAANFPKSDFECYEWWTDPDVYLDSVPNCIIKEYGNR